MQLVPCLRISERPVRFSSDHNTRWRLPFSQNKDPNTNPCYEDGSPRRRALGRVRQDGDSTGEPWIKLGNCFFVLCHVLLFFLLWMILCLKALACIFTSCHVWYIRYGYRFYCILSCITCIITILLRAHILNFKLGGGLAACLMTWVKD